MLDCPVCGTFVDGLACPKCKHREADVTSLAKYMPKPAPEPRDFAGSAAARARCMHALANLKFAKPGKGWARKILRESEQGRHYPPISVEFAREALGVKVERGDAWEPAA